MDLDNSSVGPPLFVNTTFNSIDEVQQMIKKLQLVEESMKKRNDKKENGQELDFEQLPLIDLDNFSSEPEDSWLLNSKEVPGIKPNSNSNDNFLDSRLLNVRHGLLNTVKAALNEDRANQINIVKLKRNASYVIRRESEFPEKNVQQPYQSPMRHNDVTGSYTYRLPSRRFSPGAIPIYSPERETDYDYNNKNPPINYNTYSPLAALNRTITVDKPSPSNKYATVTRPNKLGTTFTPISMDASSDEIKLNGAQELNVTFVRSSEDEALSSHSGSNNSPHNISMEELQTKARIQEQSLRMSTPLKRKDTHVISDFNADANGHQVLSSPSRTWSTDTYSLAESNPDSGASSGVSSPRDSQSYDNVQMVPNSVRRSMPNLALLKEGNRGNSSTGLQVMPKTSQVRCQPQYISDPKLSNSSRSRTITLPGRPLIAAPTVYSCPSQKQSSNNNGNKNQNPVYTRGDTFYKSRQPQVLSVSSQSGVELEQNFEAGETTYNNGRQHEGRPSIAGVMPQSRYPTAGTDYTAERRITSNTMNSAGSGLVSRPSALPTSVGATNIQKPKTRIPAPGGRMRYI